MSASSNESIVSVVKTEHKHDLEGLKQHCREVFPDRDSILDTMTRVFSIAKESREEDSADVADSLDSEQLKEYTYRPQKRPALEEPQSEESAVFSEEGKGAKVEPIPEAIEQKYSSNVESTDFDYQPTKSQACKPRLGRERQQGILIVQLLKVVRS